MVVASSSRGSDSKTAMFQCKLLAYLSLGLVVVLCCYPAAIEGQGLSVTSLPAVLFDGGSKTIVQGSVILLYCQVNSTDPTLTVTWNKDSVPVVEDIVHIRTRFFTSANSSTYLLVMDNFQSSDSGMYQCTAQEGGGSLAVGTSLTLTESSITDGSLQSSTIMDNTDIGRNFVHLGFGVLNRNRSGLPLNDLVTLPYQISHVGDDTTSYSTPTVMWLKDGEPFRTAPSNTLGSNGRLDTTLSFTVNTSDDGVYQCVINDTTRSEMFATVPIRLEIMASTVMYTVPMSTDDTTIILRPPEQLVIQTRATGGYEFNEFRRNREILTDSQLFFGFGETYLVGSTTASDLGVYMVRLVPLLGQLFSSGEIRFLVVEPVSASTTSTSAVVMVAEGTSVDITCTSTGIPVPTINWTFDNQPTPFSDNETVTDLVVDNIVETGVAPPVTPGSVRSTLHIENAQYPAHDGVYECIGTNSHAGVSYTSTAMITVQVQVVPEVTVTADRTGVGLGGQATLTCSVTRANPMATTFTWTNLNTTTQLPETSNTLTLTSITMADLATYRCNATNAAGTGMNTITIELGETPSVTSRLNPLGPVMLGTMVELVCEATAGDTPITFSWADSSGNAVSPGDTDGTVSVTVSSAVDYDTYTCTASNAIGMGTSDVIVGFAPVLAVNPLSSVQLLRPAPLSLMCTAEGFPVPTISWVRIYSDGSETEFNTRTTDMNGRNFTVSGNTVSAPNRRQSTFSISSTVVPDSANYTCRANNTFGVVNSSSSVSVHATPVITMPNDSQQFTTNEQSDITFTCIAVGSPPPSLFFQRGDENLTRTEGASGIGSTIAERVQVGVEQVSSTVDADGLYTVSRTLTLFAARDQDSGSFSCTASTTIPENGVETNMVSFSLTVQIGPVIITDPMDQVVVTGDNVTFTCSAEGLPRPTIRWFALVESIPVNLTTDTIEIVVTADPGERGVTSTVTLASVRPFQTLTYSCNATNVVNTAVSTADLSVLYAPDIVFPPEGFVITGDQFAVVTFTCSVVGTPPPVITWIRLDGNFSTSIMLTDAVMAGDYMLPDNFSVVSRVNRSLMFTEVLDEDSGEYACIANNTAGQVQRDFNLLVQVAANITRGPENTTVTAPNAVSFSCTSSGLPRPIITWLDPSSSRLVSGVGGVTIMEVEGGDRELVSTLNLATTAVSAAGEYTCETSNGVTGRGDVTSATATLLVFVTPEVTSVYPDPTQLNYTVNMGDTVTFQCVATGIPAPSITWFRNGTELSSTIDARVAFNNPSDPMLQMDTMIYEVTRTLTLSMSEDDDSGEYECRASNAATPGLDTETFELIVQVPPDPPMIIERTATVTQPEDAMFVCTAMARPRPSITWYRLEMNGSQTILTTGSEVGLSISVEDGNTERIAVSTLMFSPSRPFFSAVYICEATNLVANAEANATLEVYVTPQVTSVMDYTVNMSDPAMFVCVATGVPPPSITWFRDGTEINDTRVTLSSHTSMLMDDGDDGMVYEVMRTLTLSMSEDGDSGEYECRANNDATPGQDTDTFELIVQIPPDPPVITDRAVTVTQPQDAMFACTAMARPRPSITWYRMEMDDSRTILTTGSEVGVSISVEDGDTERIAVSTLMFSPSRPFFSAVYICEATNPVATAETNATLEVYVTPEVTSVMNYTVNMNDPAMFVCVATGIPAPFITWFRNGTELNNMVNTRVTLNNPSSVMSSDGNEGTIVQVTRTLTLAASEDGDSGMYECRASNDAMPGLDTETFELIVQIPPDPPVITERTVIVTQPEDAMFECTAMARPRPSITWYRLEMNGSRTILTTDSEDEITISMRNGDTERSIVSTIMFSPSRPSFSAVYICEATNPVATAEANATLEVYVPPEITSVYPDPTQLNYTVNMGDTVTFQCVATGIPAPSITWFRNGTELTNAACSRVMVTSSVRTVIDEMGETLDAIEELVYESTGTLTLDMSNDSDSGEYECRATNAATPGNDSMTFDLIVQVPPGPPTFAMNTVTVTQPEDAMFVCTAMARPRPSITWYRLEMNGSRTILTTDSEVGVSISVEDGDTERIAVSTLMFSPSRPFFSAVYICEATNPVATAETNATLEVYVTPEITSVMNYTVNMSETATFQCVATGIPPPSITWFRNGTELSNTVNPRVTLGDHFIMPMDDGEEGVIFEVTRTLTLGMSEDGDSGEYECRASNDATPGLDTETFELIVQIPPDPPVITERAVIVTQPDDAMFNCTAIARPRPSITWIKVLLNGTHILLDGSEEGIDITTSNGNTERTAIGTLMFSPSRPFFSAIYICQAANPVTTAETNATLEVYVTPEVTSVYPDPIQLNYTVNMSDTVTFQCVATGIPAPSITWFRNGTELNNMANTRVTLNNPSSVMSSDGNEGMIVEVTRTLTLAMSEDGDSGRYECRASNDATPGQDMELFELIVQIPPDPPVITERAVTVTQPEDAMFECTAMARPRPSFTWYRMEMDGSRTILTTDSEVGVSISVEDGDTERIAVSTLMFSPSRPFFSAVYVCEATNPVATAEANATLIVYVVPNITSVVPDGNRYVVNVTDPVTFRCEVTGVPPPSIQWFRGSDLLSPDSRISLSNLAVEEPARDLAIVGRSLTISSTFGNDSDANYSCRARNDASGGMDSVAFELFVQVPPEVFSITPSQRVVANVTESALLSFRIENAVPSVLTSDIRWYYTASTTSGEPDFESSDFLEITNLENRTSLSTLIYSADRLNLTVSDIVQALMTGEETDAGRYYLRATNPAGESNSFIDLVVRGPPQIVGGPRNQFAINNGSSAMFECNAIADPQHFISWSFTDSTGMLREKIAQTLSASSTKYNINRNESSPMFGALTVNDVMFVDRGTYTCAATNDLGEETAQANLTVHVIPIISTISQPNQTLLSNPVSIICLATGYPAPNISWQQDSADVSDSDTRINITTVELDSSTGTDLPGPGSGVGDLLMMYPELTEEQVSLLQDLGVVGVLRIDGVVRGDGGNYSCTARNQLLQTTLITATSDPVPLVILERPDPPNNVMSFNFGARWIAVRWTPTFNGNRRVLGFMLYIRNVNVTEDLMLVENLTASGLMMSGSSFMFNVSREGVVLPFTRYSFRVESCNVIGCSDQSQASPDVQTLQDTSSPPLNLSGISTTTDMATLRWEPPTLPNGIISSYQISFSGIKDYNQSFSHMGELSLPLSELEVNMMTREVRYVVDQLFSGTEYTLMVTAVNGAAREGGVGMPSAPVTVFTVSAPPPPPTLPVIAGELPTLASAEDDDDRAVVIPLPRFSTDNGPISHYHVVVILLSLGETQEDLREPDIMYRSIDDFDEHNEAFCDEEFPTAKAYITAEFAAEDFPSSGLFVVGGSGGPNAPNDRDQYTNSLLCYNKQYTFFVRAYNQPVTQSGSNRRAVRQTTERQYNDFTSSGYYGTTTTATAPVSAVGIAVGVVIAIVVVTALLVVVIVLVVIAKNRTFTFKPDEYYVTTNATVDDAIALTSYCPPEEGSEMRQPIPLQALGPHVERMHLNENCGFGEEYKIIQDKSPKKPVETCIQPENKPRNRYANIQCFDETRVDLTPVEGSEHDYINANFIEGYNRKKEYIAAQGPLPDTIGDFWRMIWDYNAPTVVMLTNLVEKMKVKCSQYWPNSDSAQYAHFSVTLINTITHADFVTRHFQLKNLNTEETREVRQYHFISWPDFGVPRHATPLLYFLRRIRNVHRYTDERPLVIHCSAGVGRTGSLITIDMESQRMRKDKAVDPFNTVKHLRQQRNHMVQTEAQYVFLHDAILEEASSGNTEVSVEKLAQRMAELEKVDDEDESGYKKEFQLLRQFKVNVREFTDANDDDNKFKNRVANALPYNHNRVHLQKFPGIGGSDYINASYIDGYSKKGTYIATQGPLPNTVDDFWRMIWEKEVNVIVMLTQLEEKGKAQSAQYWPNSVNSPEKMGNFSIELLSENSFEDYIMREVKITEITSGNHRTLKHFHFLSWPENGAPISGVGMVDLIDQVTRTQLHTGNKPIVVHCSAGIGRTGAFCSLSTAIERVKAEGIVDVFHTIKHLRTQRPHMVQNVDQYIFCYRAIHEYVESLNAYSNFV